MAGSGAVEDNQAINHVDGRKRQIDQLDWSVGSMTGLERAPVICRAGQQKYSRWLCWALRRGEVNGYKGKRRKEKKVSQAQAPARQGLGALLGTFLRPLTLAILGCSRVPTGYLKKLKRRPSDGHSTREGREKDREKEKRKVTL